MHACTLTQTHTLTHTQVRADDAAPYFLLQAYLKKDYSALTFDTVADAADHFFFVAKFTANTRAYIQ